MVFDGIKRLNKSEIYFFNNAGGQNKPLDFTYI